MDMGEFFRKYTEAYDAVMSPRGYSVYKQLLELHKNALKGRQKVLDSGCGPGNLAIELLKDDAEVHALDQNQDALTMLERKSKGLPGRLQTYCKDIHELPFGDNSFDGVSSMLVLPFMERPTDYLIENKRVMKPEGILVVSGPDEEARDRVNWMMQRWRQDLKDQGLWEKLKNQVEIMERYTKENVRDNVRNWFSLSKISEILRDEVGLRLISQLSNPMYYGMGYVVVAEKP